MKKQNMQEIPWGKETLGALDTPLNELEKKALQNLDVDKLNDCLLYTSDAADDL